MTQRVLLHAPIAGWLGDLREVPDPVFAERMMGEGVAIDPVEGVLVAPCDGTILLVPASAHSVTLRADNGAEILMHIGIETVRLAGRGFEAHVATGQSVRRGDRLISFDLDVLADGAASLMTPIVLASAEGFRFVPLATDRSIALGEPLAEIIGAAAASAAGSSKGQHCELEIVVPLPNGIHARPAARIAALARQFTAELTLHCDGRHANARSPIALMVLAAAHGDRVRIAGSGADAESAVAALARLITDEIDEPADHGPAACPPAPVSPPPAGGLSGVCAVPGIAIGPAFHLRTRDLEVPEQGSGVDRERQALTRARTAVSQNLAVAADSSTAASSVAAAHLALIDDIELLAAAESHIAAGKGAGFAWRQALRDQSGLLGATGNTLLIERVDDLLDLERSVLAEIGGDAGTQRLYPPGVVLLADEILPSQLMHLDTCRPAAICTARGGPTSHAAVMAAAAGVPMLVAVGEGIAAIADGPTLFVDTAAGQIGVDPSPATLAAARARIAAAEARDRTNRATALEPGQTADGTHIEVFANLGSGGHAALAVAEGAEGCGLLRTEFLFLDREQAPTEDEQRAAYQAIADALGDRPLIVRTLDVGGDKPIPYLPIPAEDNPALGLRGVRTSLWRTELLDAQLRAILGVTPAGRCRIMVPMIVALAELRAVRERLDRIAAEMGIAAPIQLGIMVETPAAAALADQLAAEADFFSVGSNDLTQYTLAMDRGNPLVAAQVDSFHPAVLRLIANTANAAVARSRPLGVCGGLASDPVGAALLVGLGATELSVAPSAIAGVKAALRSVTLDECRALAEQALAAESPEAVRALVRAALHSSEGEA